MSLHMDKVWILFEVIPYGGSEVVSVHPNEPEADTAMARATELEHEKYTDGDYFYGHGFRVQEFEVEGY